MSDDGAARPAADARFRPGDVGRRIAQRRAELGLGRDEVADRAGVAEDYLRYVEEQPADVANGSLLRLAGALETTVDRLRGADADTAPGTGRAARHPVLRELTVPECWQRLGTHGVGRVALQGPAGPAVLPVNYTVVDGAIAYRTTPELAREAESHGEVAFEVDRADEALSQGWSVLAVGPAEAVDDPQEVRRLDGRAFSEPWAGGDRSCWVRVAPRHVSGRRITAAS
jgi:transcriptional regulator with XRE-family HTH domain